jgi:pimeloyl-ACP methyl ester carboxylesterase
MRSVYCTALVLAFAASLAGAPAGGIADRPDASAPQAASAESTFKVFVRGVQVGTESVSVVRTPEGTTISGAGRLAPPFDITTNRCEIRYDNRWRPVEMNSDAIVQGQYTLIHARFADGDAAMQVVVSGKQTNTTVKIGPDDIVLLSSFFGLYEALPARLAGLPPGSQLRAYVVLQSEIGIDLEAVSEERIQTPSRTIATRHYTLALGAAARPTRIDLWSDEDNRLVRIAIPAQSVEMVREDVSSVAARREAAPPRAGDEQVTIPASGFSLAGTVSRPAGAKPAKGKSAVRYPAVVLVGGSGMTDRDEVVAGVPIFAQLANGLADAGFVVVRYDKRGVGQSGGRADTATLAAYADDARAVVKYLRSRKDVDRKRVALAGHGEGGWASMLAADHNKDVAALVLVATPGLSGSDFVLAQQQHALDRMKISPVERQAKIDLQEKIDRAVVTGTGWESIPVEYRKQVENDRWFHSILTFDPAKVMPRVRQPILILQGDLDRQVFATQADRLAELARARKAPAGNAVTVVHVPGVNHLLVPSATGEYDEYPTLAGKNVSNDVLAAVVTWLRKTL